MGLRLDHNVPEVKNDLDEVQGELWSQMRARVERVMRSVRADAVQYVLDDPDASGDLAAALEFDADDGSGWETSFTVFVNVGRAPYGAVVEFGSGSRGGTQWPAGASTVSANDPRVTPPEGWPYDAPDIDNLSGFAFYIEEWMRDKGLTPRTGSMRASALAIAKTIADRGEVSGTFAHPYLRPAWFQNEMDIRRAARRAVKNAVN